MGENQKKVYSRCRERKGKTTKEPESVKHEERALEHICYEHLSKECDQLTEEYQPVTDTVEKTEAHVVSASKIVADELQCGFQRVRKAISETRQ